MVFTTSRASFSTSSPCSMSRDFSFLAVDDEGGKGVLGAPLGLYALMSGRGIFLPSGVVVVPLAEVEAPGAGGGGTAGVLAGAGAADGGLG